jgi:hypothetical protein
MNKNMKKGSEKPFSVSKLTEIMNLSEGAVKECLDLGSDKFYVMDVDDRLKFGLLNILFKDIEYLKQHIKEHDKLKDKIQ